MQLAPLPVDLVSEVEWSAGCAVRDARHTDNYRRAERDLDAITGSIERSMRVMVTVEDAYRALAVAQHPAGTISGHENAALPKRSALLVTARRGQESPRTPAPSRQALDVTRVPSRADGSIPSTCHLRPVEPCRAPGDAGRGTDTPARTFAPLSDARLRAPGARPVTDPQRWPATDRILYSLGVICLAAIVVQLARGGW
jgi:hypothetical protein